MADLAILPAKDARERLYELYKWKWVNYLELSKRNDYNPSSTYYSWKSDFQMVREMVLESLYQSLLNLRCRREFEFGNGKELLEFATFKQVPLDGDEAKRFDKMSFSLDILDGCTLRLMDHMAPLNIAR